jgi:DNA polymerase III alpha subunit
MVTSSRLVFTKANAQEMAFVKIEDDSGSIEAVVFPKVYSRTKECWGKNQIVLIKGRIQIREDSPNLIVDEAKLIEKEQGEETKEAKPIDWDFEVTLPSQLSPRKLVEINKLLKQNQGKSKLALAFVDNLGQIRRMILPFGVDYSKELQKEIKRIIEE